MLRNVLKNLNKYFMNKVIQHLKIFYCLEKIMNDYPKLLQLHMNNDKQNLAILVLTIEKSTLYINPNKIFKTAF